MIKQALLLNLNTTITVLENLSSDMFNEDAKRHMIVKEIRRLEDLYKIIKNST